MKRTRKIKIKKIIQLSPNMKRITFFGNDLYDFPKNENGGYIKILFKKKLNNKDILFARPFTIRNFRKPQLELDIDFSHHSNNQGYATKWAYNAKIGDEISISGPGSKQLINISSNWFFFVGDMTALPAISAYLEKLPEQAIGYVVIEILSVHDKINIRKPKKIKIQWIIKSNQDDNSFINAVKNVKWLDQKPYVWVACEFTKMKYLRIFFQREKKICKNNMYISSYWKSGLTQEEHKIVKKEDSLGWIS